MRFLCSGFPMFLTVSYNPNYSRRLQLHYDLSLDLFVQPGPKQPVSLLFSVGFVDFVSAFT